MQKNKKLIITLFLISFCLLFMVCSKGGSKMSYKEVRNLCNEIRNENVEESIKIIEKSNNLNKTTYPPFLERFFSIIDYQGGITTPLIEAVRVGNIEIIEALLKKGADPNYCEGCGFTTIEKIYKVAKLQNRFEIAQLLIKYGADVNNAYDPWDYPMFNMIFRERNEPTLMAHTRLFIENGAYVVNKTGCCVIDYFIDTPYLEECVDCVLEYTDYDINTIQPNGKTHLMYAVECQEVHAVEVLLSRGSDKTIKNSDGKTALEIANEIGNIEIIQLLDE